MSTWSDKQLKLRAEPTTCAPDALSGAPWPALHRPRPHPIRDKIMISARPGLAKCPSARVMSMCHKKSNVPKLSPSSTYHRHGKGPHRRFRW